MNTPLALVLKYYDSTKIRIYEKDLCDRCIADPFILWRFLIGFLILLKLTCFEGEMTIKDG